MNSCNPAFITWGLRVGVDNFLLYMEKLGLMQKTGVDLPGEASTIMHKKEDIKELELATMSFGQSFQITPLQLLRAVSCVVNGGTLVTPHFGVKSVDTDGNITELEYGRVEGVITQQTCETMKTLLKSVVHEGGGSKCHIEGYSIGGKTATSQKLPRSEQKYISSFIGFCPAEDPQVIAMCIIDEPQGIYYGGTIAAPVIREVFENILPYLGIVVGTGVSGIGSAGLLERVGARVVIYDGNGKLDKNAVLAKLPTETEAEIVIGELTDDVLCETELAVISPGVPIDSPVVRRFEEAKITNEKTFVVGNIGTSYTGETLKTSADSVTVAEISSFQLESTHDFAPKGTAILNITPDHLDRHYTMENYIAVKESITRNQGSDGFCVLNYDDEVLREFGKTLQNPIYFSRKVELERGVYLDGTMIKYVDGTKITDIIDVNDMFIFGSHNYENVMAAAAIAINAGVPAKVITDTVKNFKGVEHRIEFVREKDGVVYYNDSKGTNPDSSIKALEAMSRPTLLIAGGYDKHSEFDGFLDAFEGKVKLMALIGATAPQIEKTALAHGFDRILRAESLEEAVKICSEHAKSGDAVLLSPACASWDMFKSYEERGRLFKEYVGRL